MPTPDRSRIFVVDDDRAVRFVLTQALRDAGLVVQAFDSAEAALAALDGEPLPALVFTDIRMPGMDGLAFLDALKLRAPTVPVVVMSAYTDIASTAGAFRGGALEYLSKPFDLDDAVALAERLLQRPQTTAIAVPRRDDNEPDLIGETPAMRDLYRAIGRLSQVSLAVLITGETGTGKELVARALHRESPRASKPFIALNTAAIPAELLESELFGHEAGAFTGANKRHVGRFEQAHGGTLFLDEIGDMPAELQTRLLRVLADGEFYRVGGHAPVKVDVRIIAATHQDLEKRVKEGLFREDLFHRLNVIRIHIPALRERREDVPLLMQHFLKQAASELGVEAKRVDGEVADYLTTLDWPGNVRQLENICRWLTVMSPGQEIHLEDLPPELQVRHEVSSSDEDWTAPLRRWAEHRLGRGDENLLGVAEPEFERIMIETALKKTGGHRQEAARLLGWGRNTLTRKIKELGMGDGEE